MATVDSLAVYFILNEAREKLGFAPEEYGLSEDDAVTIARMFAKYAQTSPCTSRKPCHRGSLLGHVACSFDKCTHSFPALYV